MKTAYLKLLSCLLVYLLISELVRSQDSTSMLGKLTSLPGKFLNKLNGKTSNLDKQLTKQTENYLQKLAKREAKLKKKLSKYDSNAAKNLSAGNPEQQYAMLLAKFKKDSAAIARPMSGQYMPYTDSLKTTLAFLNKNPQLISSSKILPADLQKSLSQLNQLQSKMQDAEQIKQFIQQRKEQLKQYLSRYTHLPSGITNSYSDYNKQLYYYSAQLKEYKDMLNDPDKMLKTALAVLNKLPVFTSFMKSNSMLAGLLNIPNNAGPGISGATQAVTGLSTRDQLMASIQGQFTNGGPNINAMVQQNVQSAEGQMDQLRNKLNAPGSSGGEIDVPDFQPNSQKVKSFLKRLEFGTNMQTTHSTFFFPATTDFALTVGYKLNSKNIVGIGASYKVGWGQDFSHINISSQGIGLRSFIDLKMNKNLYASGGFEYNYQQPFYSIRIVNNLGSWQQSGLIGVSKIVSMNTKVLKKTKMQLLWDFLSYQQIPRGQPFKFRVGYSF